MTKSQLIDGIHKKRNSDFTKPEVRIVVDNIFDLIKDSLAKGERVEIRNFGNFSLRKREDRKAMNPKTGERVDVSPKSVPFFKAGRELKKIR